MPAPQPVYSAFTSKYDKVARRLINRVRICHGDKSVEVDALWDTGATNTCISHAVVKDLHLISTGKQKIKTPSGESIVDTYAVRFVLPNNVVTEELQVSDTEIGAQNIGALIGMDVISTGDFAISNYDGKTIFTFRIPSKKVTDYVQQIAFENASGRKHGKGTRKRK